MARPALWSRETRVLLVVLAISAGALALLARFRFPQQERPVNPAPPPLERLAARATFDELASIVAQLQTRVDPSLLVLRVVGPPTPTLASLRAILRPADGSADRLRLVPAVRVRADLAVAQLTPADRIQDIVASEGSAQLIGVDPVRLIGLVRVPPGADPSAVWRGQAAPTSPRYVAVAEATPGGPSLRPLFLGRTDPLNDVRWKRPLLALGGASVTQPGSLIFSLDGALEGLAVLEESLPAIAPASALLAAVDDLESGRVVVGGDFGFQVEDLRPAVAAAAGATDGAVVDYVRTGGPSDGLLQVGDVITAFNGAPTYAAEPLLVEMSRTPAGTAVHLTVVRLGQTSDVTLTVGPPEGQASPAGAPSDDGIGMILRGAPRVGAEVLRVLASGPARTAGLRPGDVITSVNGAAAPAPSDVERAYRALASGGSLLLGVARQGEPTVLALRKP